MKSSRSRSQIIHTFFAVNIGAFQKDTSPLLHVDDFAYLTSFEQPLQPSCTCMPMPGEIAAAYMAFSSGLDILRSLLSQANWMKAQGVKKGDAVAIYMPMLCELPISMVRPRRLVHLKIILISLGGTGQRAHIVVQYR